MEKQIKSLAQLQRDIAKYEDSEDYKCYLEMKKQAKSLDDELRLQSVRIYEETGIKLLHPALRIQMRKDYEFDEASIRNTVIVAGSHITDYSFMDALRINKSYMDKVINMLHVDNPEWLEFDNAILKKQMSKGNEWLSGLYTEVKKPYAVLSKDLSEFAQD